MLYALAIFIYLGVGGYLGYLLTRPKFTNNAIQHAKLGFFIPLIIALILHGALLAPQIVTDYGLNFGFYQSIGLIGAFLLLYFLLLSYKHAIISLGVLAIPSALMGLISVYLGKDTIGTPIHANFGLQAHIFLSFSAYCLLFMAGICAIILKLQIRELKRKSRQRFWVSKLPPLQSMDRLLFDMILFGFVLLSIALIVGVFSIENIFLQHIAHKIFFSVLSWLVFGALVVCHYKKDLHGNQMANLSLIGFALLAVGFIGSKFVLQLILA